MPNALVTVACQTNLAGGLELAGNLKAIANITNGYFVLFNDLIAVSTLINGTFDTITLNGASLYSLNFAALADTGGGGSFILDGNEYTFTYRGNATSDTTTGGNDVLITYVGVAVPKPGTWAMMLGGLGMLLVGQHLRRRVN